MSTTTTTTTESTTVSQPPSKVPAPPKEPIKTKKYVRPEKTEKKVVEEKEPVHVHFDVVLHRQEIASISNFRLVATGTQDKNRLKRTIVAFDLDRTLKYSSLKEKAPLKEGQKIALPLIKVRSGDSMIELLKYLASHGATMLVLTARGPSPTKHQTVLHELERLDLLKFFQDDVKPDWYNIGTEESPSRVYGGNGVLVCDYYKPHAFLHYIKLRQLKPKRILFVDDFVANVTAFADFLKENADNSQLGSLTHFEGIWFDPQVIIDDGDMGASNSENSYDFMYTSHRKVFKGLKQKEVDPKQIKNNQFHHKLRYGDKIEKIKEFLDDPDIDIDGADKYGRTPLSVASKRGFKETVELLIDRKAKLDEVCDRDNTAIMYAAMQGHEEICDLLIAAKADLTKENKFYRRCDVLAAKNGHSELAKKLEDAGVYADCT